MEYQVCEVTELEERKPLAVDLDGTEVGVIFSKGEVYAYENRCAHFGGPVCLGDVFARIKLRVDENQMALDEYVDEDDLRLVCPWHAYEFELQTGVCTVDPGLSIRKFHAYVKDGHVYVDTGRAIEANITK
jgi:nitrite reductase (NADH) small subunit